MDLRVWAKANRYRTKLEESYAAETDAHVKGDGRWYVEVPCKRGKLYPRGGDTIVAWTNSYATRVKLDALAGLKASRTEGPTESSGTVWSREFTFPSSMLDEVAELMAPKMIHARAGIPVSPEVRDRLALAREKSLKARAQQ